MSAASRIAILGLALLALTLAPSGAEAQGFFETLFGFGNGQQSSRSNRSASPRATSPNYREPAYRSPSRYHQGEPSWDRGSKYRTLCVRTCDGYYFPISGSATRSDFHRDADICRRSCGSEAQLFYHPSSSGDASNMVDLSGRSYAHLPTAFLYRKKLVSSCTCRPAPWTASEIARHKRYAASAEKSAETTKPNETKGDTERLATGPEKSAAQSSPLAGDPNEPTSSRTEVENTAPSPVVSEAPAPVIQPRPVPSPLRTEMKSHGTPAITRARGNRYARPKPSAKKTNGFSGFFGLGLANQNQKKLRWPGD